MKDGMDISFCILNKRTGELSWAGANNPLWIVRKESNTLEEIKPDKQPIGKYIRRKLFTTHHLFIKKEDSVYVFTDGYADQFGGEDRKKFMYKKLKELILSISN